MVKSNKAKIVSSVNVEDKENGVSLTPFFRFFIFSLFHIFTLSVVFAQTPPPQPPRTVIVKKPHWKKAVKIENQSGMPAEKSIAVDAKVNVSLCVSEGRLKINGWDRNEIRAFVAGGSQVGFKILQKGRQNEKPVWIAILGFDPSKNTEANPDECLAGEEIEIDVPRYAVVSIKSNESETLVDSVGKVTVKNIGGDIRISNVAQGVEATTYEGDVTVEKSSGAMSLTTTTGNIIAIDAAPGAIGDVFKAKTNSGSIILQQTEHRQIDADSTSGAIRFTGEFLSGGQYNLKAFNGTINVSIPPNSSCKLNASYGFGSFKSEIPLQNVVKSTPAKGQNISAQIGSGEATLNLTTYSGGIQIKKQ